MEVEAKSAVSTQITSSKISQKRGLVVGNLCNARYKRIGFWKFFSTPDQLGKDRP